MAPAGLRWGAPQTPRPRQGASVVLKYVHTYNVVNDAEDNNEGDGGDVVLFVTIP